MFQKENYNTLVVFVVLLMFFYSFAFSQLDLEK